MTQVTRNRHESRAVPSRFTVIVCSAAIEPLRLITDDQRSDNGTVLLTDSDEERRCRHTRATEKLCPHDCAPITRT